MKNFLLAIIYFIVGLSLVIGFLGGLYWLIFYHPVWFVSIMGGLIVITSILGIKGDLDDRDKKVNRDL